MPQKIIIDTDPGIDDAFAILYASYHPDIELTGLTTVFGNVAVDQTTKNAQFLNTLLKQPVPIAKGAERPIKKGLLGYAEFVHGDDGLGNTGFQLDNDATDDVLSISAAEFIVEQINQYPGEITLVPIGPLTNIAHALELDASIASKVKSVVLMGGCVEEPGNVTPVAEANIWNDPHAADAVFRAPWPVVMVGLDVTHQLTMSNEHTQQLAKDAPTNGQFLDEIGRFYQQFYMGRGFAGFAVHDPTAIVYVAHPEWFESEQGQVDVLVDGLGVGQTLFARESRNYITDYYKQRSNVTVPFQVQQSLIIEDIMSVLGKMP